MDLNNNSDKKNIDEIECIICSNHFDTNTHLPLVCVNCGKSVCDICIKAMLEISIKANHLTQKCPQCNFAHKIAKGKVKGFPENYSITKIIKKISFISDSVRCNKHPKQVCSYICLDITCALPQSIFCGICLSQFHDNCDNSKIMPTEDVRPNIQEYKPPFKIADWKQINHNSIKANLEKIGKKLHKIVDVFASYFTYKTSEMTEFNLNNLQNNFSNVKIKQKSPISKSFFIDSKIDEFLLEISQNLTSCFGQSGLFEQSQMAINQSLVYFSRKLFNDPTNEILRDSTVFNKIKKIDWFVQQRYFLKGFEKKKFETIFQFAENIKKQFDEENFKEDFKITKDFKHLKLKNFDLSLICGNSLAGFGTDISQIEIKIAEMVNTKWDQTTERFRCVVHPNVIQDDEQEIQDQVFFKFRDLQIHLYKIT